jgi:hypothetical protein
MKAAPGAPLFLLGDYPPLAAIEFVRAAPDICTIIDGDIR